LIFGDQSSYAKDKLRGAPEMTRALTRIQEFLKLEASAGLVLMAMAILAMIFANTNLASIYSGILDTNVRIGIASFEISKPALLWINDGLDGDFLLLGRAGDQA
jgi:NhaA family Na+:H+ antiporter